jgi:hypothetical protein
LKCGIQTGHVVEFDGLLACSVLLCVSCFDAEMIGFRELQRQFQELIDAGVSRKDANLTMIARIDQMSERPTISVSKVTA